MSSGTSSNVSTTVYPITPAIVDVKTGSELIYMNDISSPCSGGNKISIVNRIITSTTPISFPAIIQLKAPCTYIVDTKISIMSDNGNILAFFGTYRMNQLIPGGTFTLSAPSLPFLNNSSTATGSNLVVYTKNPLTDSVDLELNPTNGGTMTCSVWIEIFNDVDF